MEKLLDENKKYNREINILQNTIQLIKSKININQNKIHNLCEHDWALEHNYNEKPTRYCRKCYMEK